MNNEAEQNYLKEFIKRVKSGGKIEARSYIDELSIEDIRKILKIYGREIPSSESWARDRAYNILQWEAIKIDRKLINRLL